MLALAAVLAPRGYAMLKPSTANLDATLEKHHHEKPWFCHGLDCPEYTVVEKNDAYEVREYEEGKLCQEFFCFFRLLLPSPLFV